MAFVGRVCLVTGASRGIGKGIAKALTSQGSKVYITGRNETTLSKVAAELGVNAIPIVCDHSDDAAIEQLFKQIEADNNGQLDMLVNNCFAAVMTLLGKESDKPIGQFWEQEPQVWDKINGVGLRANYIASVHAARLMVARKEGTIVNISSAGGIAYALNAAYGVGKAGMDRMSQDLNIELKGTGVHALAVWPGGVKTEVMKEYILYNESPDEGVQALRNLVAAGTSTDWVGRTVAPLLTDKNIAKKAGGVVWCYDLADEFKIVENDGSVHPSHRSLKHIYIYFSGLPKSPLPSGPEKIIPAFIRVPKVIYNCLLWVMGNKF